jgi:hypothetical protein
MRGSAITPQSLTNEQLPLIKAHTVPGQSNQLCIPQTCAQPKGKAGVKPLLIAGADRRAPA